MLWCDKIVFLCFLCLDIPISLFCWMLQQRHRWDLCIRWLTQGVLLYEDNTWWWSILFKDRNLMAKYIYYQNMFNKTNESTKVETALATSALAMVFIPSMPGQIQGIICIKQFHNTFNILRITYDIMTRHFIMIIFRYIWSKR